MLKEQFGDVLAEFGASVGQSLALDEDGVSTFTVDDEVLVSLTYLDESDVVVLFSPVGGFGGVDGPDAGEKALELLRMNDLGGETEGFTLALDEDADIVLALDRRSRTSRTTGAVPTSSPATDRSPARTRWKP